MPRKIPFWSLNPAAVWIVSAHPPTGNLASAMLSRLVTFVLLFALWLVLSGFFDAFHLTLGLVCCGLVTWWSGDLLFEDRGVTLGRLVRRAIGLCGYLLWLGWQIVLSNLHLMRLSLGDMKDVSPRIVKFRTGLQTDFGKFMLANSITITPGTITLKIVGDVFYVHAVSAAAADGLDGSMERRIAAVFEPEHAAGKEARP
jgi:multicomponent Na+:H+ antiporter subunit E